jgi:hypothetical protein
MVNNNSPNPFDILIEKFREVVREEIRTEVRAALGGAKERPPSTPSTEWYRAEELAAIYKMPRTFFEEKGREGKITRAKPGRVVLFYRPDVERYLQKQATGGGQDH